MTPRNGPLSFGAKTIRSTLFKRLDLTAVLELACGHGRHSEIVAEGCGQLTLMDVHEENIEYCRTRLARFQNTVFITNSGHDLQPIIDDALTAIFAMMRWCISALALSKPICATRRGS
jgi:ubiquinone/menaquinone biosynthesis C-methylase UbiE